MITEETRRRRRQQSVLASLRRRTVEVNTVEDALARQRETTSQYIDTITGQLADALATVAADAIEVNRLNRCLRVLRNSTKDIPVLNDQVQRAIDGERL